MVVPNLYRVIVFVAIDAAEGGEITTQMAVGTVVPFALVLAAVNREVHVVVVESRGYPGRFGVAIFAGGREAG